MTHSKDIALNKIRAEHRTLAAVINNLKEMVMDVRTGKLAMDFPLFWLMIHYIDSFPDQFHHPKESDWLFRLVKLRTDSADALIAELLKQHDLEPTILSRIRKCLGNFEAGVPGSIDVLAAEIHSYADFTWKHLKAEEHEFFAFAEAHLTESDWDQIAQAFSENKDPLAGHHDSQHFSELFREILNKTPAPFGLGHA
jgi:hemerythrin-like domain-containing protein